MRKLEKTAEATSRFEGLPKVIKSQADDIDEMKAKTETNQAHVIS